MSVLVQATCWKKKIKGRMLLFWNAEVEAVFNGTWKGKRSLFDNEFKFILLQENRISYTPAGTTGRWCLSLTTVVISNSRKLKSYGTSLHF